MPDKCHKHFEKGNHSQPNIRLLAVGTCHSDQHLQEYWKVRHYLNEKE